MYFSVFDMTLIQKNYAKKTIHMHQILLVAAKIYIDLMENFTSLILDRKPIQIMLKNCSQKV